MYISKPTLTWTVLTSCPQLSQTIPAVLVLFVNQFIFSILYNTIVHIYISCRRCGWWSTHGGEYRRCWWPSLRWWWWSTHGSGGPGVIAGDAWSLSSSTHWWWWLMRGGGDGRVDAGGGVVCRWGHVVVDIGGGGGCVIDAGGGVTHKWSWSWSWSWLWSWSWSVVASSTLVVGLSTGGSGGVVRRWGVGQQLSLLLLSSPSNDSSRGSRCCCHRLMMVV